MAAQRFCMVLMSSPQINQTEKKMKIFLAQRQRRKGTQKEEEEKEEDGEYIKEKRFVFSLEMERVCSKEREKEMNFGCGLFVWLKKKAPKSMMT